MRLRTYEDVAEAAGVSVDDVLQAVEEGYLVRGLVTPYSDDSHLILNTRHCKNYVKNKGDLSHAKKWKGRLGENSMINGWNVCVVRYRGSWLGIVINPTDFSNYYTFANYSKKRALLTARKFASKDERHVPSASKRSSKGWAIHVSLTYDDMENIVKAMDGTFENISLINKMKKAMKKSIKKKEGYYGND